MSETAKVIAFLENSSSEENEALERTQALLASPEAINVQILTLVEAAIKGKHLQTTRWLMDGLKFREAELFRLVRRAAQAGCTGTMAYLLDEQGAPTFLDDDTNVLEDAVGHNHLAIVR